MNARVNTPGNALARGPAPCKIPKKGAGVGRGKARLGEAGKRRLLRGGKKPN